MKKVLLFFAFLFSYSAAYSQDTITVEGIFLEPTSRFMYDVEGDPRGAVGCWDCYLLYYDGFIHKEAMQRGMFFLKFAYMQFVGSTRYKADTALLNAKIVYKNYVDYSTVEPEKEESALYQYPVGRFWNKVSGVKTVGFPTYKAKFKCVKYGEVERKIGNIEATTEKEAMVTVTVPLYVIVDILEMEHYYWPVKEKEKRCKRRK